MLKRGFDLLAASVGLIALAPVLLLVAILVRWNMGSPVLFRQQRPGRGGRPFNIIKFRTMRSAQDKRGHPLPDDQRLTPLGCFLRKASLDELPELVNVLKGEMSLVGPRPLLMRYLPYFTEREKLRHQVRPGITGWAQVQGRNLMRWDDRLAADVWYVENQSFGLDLKILAMTLIQVFQRKNILVDARSAMLNLDEEREQRLHSNQEATGEN